MNQTHVSYAVSKRLKEFLGESAPEPMGKWSDGWHCFSCGCQKRCEDMDMEGEYGCTKYGATPKYQLHDLLSKPFCEVMAKQSKHKAVWSYEDVKCWISDEYCEGGMPSVEKALLEIMGTK